MNTVINKTSPSLYTSTSRGHVAYLDIGPIPVCVPCDAIEECPTCPIDQAYKVPVVAGDLVYFQFRLEDHYNANPVIPDYGWLSNPSDQYWLAATIEFANLDSIPLPFGDFIRSNSLGWANGSYQNLVIDSAKVFEYIQSEQLATDCWRIKLETFRKVVDEFFVVVSIGSEFPLPPIPQGAYAVVGDVLYIYNLGEWASVQQIQTGDWVQLTKNGLFYQFDGEEWVEGTPQNAIVQDRTCFTSWHKFAICETTVLLEGIFGFQDCQGYFYGITEEQQAAGNLPFRDRWRIWGSFEMQAVLSERTETDEGVLLTLIQNEEWILRNNPGLPEKVIRRLANTLNATRTFINSNEYKSASDIRKINPAGLYWFISVTVQRLLCEKRSDCDDDFVFNPLIECPGIPTTSGTVIRTSENNVIATVFPPIYTLPDDEVRIFVEGILQQTVSIPPYTNQSINIQWT
jgi:hypothetical protein